MIPNKLLTDVLILATDYSATRGTPVKLLFPEIDKFRVVVLGDIMGFFMDLTVAPHGYKGKEFLLSLDDANMMLRSVRNWDSKQQSTLILAGDELTVVSGGLYCQATDHVPEKTLDYIKPFIADSTTHAIRIDSVVMGVVLHDCSKLSGCKNPVLTTHGPGPGVGVVLDFASRTGCRVKAAFAPVTMDPKYTP